jgi:hypothetical protein
MQRYLLFSGEAYYPGGGAEDFRGSYPTLVECMQSDGVFDQWWNVLDTRTGRVYNYHEVDFNQRLEWAAGIDSEA